MYNFVEMIPRSLAKTVKKNQKPGLINLIYGPRQVGKTVLLHQLTQKTKDKDMIWFNGDTREAQQALSQTSEVALSKLVGGKKVVVIDEAQRVSNIGLSSKILVDKFPHKTFYVTGSSSLMLSRGVQEALTGRNLTYRLYPLSTRELTRDLPEYKKKSFLDEQLILGGYPYLTHLSTSSEKERYLTSLIDDYLFKDLFYLENINRPEAVRKLATLLAFQIGSEVSFNELANSLNISVKTVIRYVGLLKKAFIIFEIGAFSRNLRKEVTESKKYYFWDLGIRNALTGQFQELDARTDVGQLWENFLAVERKKKHHYRQRMRQYYFWRTYQKAELDWIEVKEDQIFPYEFKWSKSRVKTPKAFKEAYREEAKVVNKENYLDFVL